ncbi:hypothetical protein [Streptomyces microflavus]|uniref:hypothetical protein n=1 Tax=Streptomyces microflavus TaxID=1919 RepID=UPI003B20FCD6
MPLRRLLHPAFPLALVRLEEGVQECLTLEGACRQGRQQGVVGGFVAEPALVPGVRVADPGLALGGRHPHDEVLLNIEGRRHA